MAVRVVPGMEQGAAGARRVPGGDLRLSLPIETSSAGLARQAMREYLASERVLGDIIDDVVLATDEACINVILHSEASGRLRLRAQMIGRRVRVEVRDSGRGFAAEQLDRQSPVAPLAAHGRGLFLITQLMDDVHIESHPGLGTVVEMHKRV